MRREKRKEIEKRENVPGQPESCLPVLLSQACFLDFLCFFSALQRLQTSQMRWEQGVWNKKRCANRKEAGNTILMNTGQEGVKRTDDKGGLKEKEERATAPKKVN